MFYFLLSFLRSPVIFRGLFYISFCFSRWPPKKVIWLWWPPSFYPLEHRQNNRVTNFVLSFRWPCLFYEPYVYKAVASVVSAGRHVFLSTYLDLTPLRAVWQDSPLSVSGKIILLSSMSVCRSLCRFVLVSVPNIVFFFSFISHSSHVGLGVCLSRGCFLSLAINCHRTWSMEMVNKCVFVFTFNWCSKRGKKPKDRNIR